ncbi:MAG: DUF4350 domain-containing protein, partial [Methanobacterium sp.]
MRDKLNLIFATKKLKIVLIFLLIIPILFSSLNSVSALDNKKILFDESSPNFGKFNTIHSIGNYGSSGFASLLQENGYTVSTITDRPLTLEKLKDYGVLIIMDQTRNYTDDEVQAIKEFVNDGGGLLIVGSNWGDIDGDQNFAYNKIARNFGVSFANNELVTNDQNYFFISSIVEINDLRPSKITENVNKLYYMMGTYIKDPGPSQVVAYTDSNTWGDRGYTTSEGMPSSNFKKDPNEQSGPLPVVSQMQYGNGKVVFMGSSYSFINSFIYRSDAWKLGLNSVNWLANNSSPATYKPISIIPLNLILPQILEMIVFTALALSGLTFAVRRNRKLDDYKTIKTIKNWKFRGLITSNAITTFLAAIMFIPINFYLFDISDPLMYDATLGYTLIITGALFLFFMVIVLFNLVARQRMLINYSYINIIIILLFAGLTVI